MTLAVTAHPGVPDRSKTLGGSGWGNTLVIPGGAVTLCGYDTDAGGKRLAFVGDAVKDEAELDGGPFSVTEDAAASARYRTRLLELEQKGACLFLGHSGWARSGTRGGSGT